MPGTTEDLHQKYEPHPDPQKLTGNHDENGSGLPRGVTKDVDYEPHPEHSIPISSEHETIIKHIINLYSGSCSEEDMQVYDEKAIYDDPYSYCDTRYKIAGQWYGLPVIFSSLRTLKTQVVSDTPSEIIFKLQHEYTLKGVHLSKAVNSLVSLGLDEKTGKVKYHKDMWNEKDYSHQGLGKMIKKLNGDQLTRVTKPPEGL